MTDNKYYVDPAWCFNHSDEAAAELARLHKWCDQFEIERDEALEREAVLAARVEWLSNEIMIVDNHIKQEMDCITDALGVDKLDSLSKVAPAVNATLEREQALAAHVERLDNELQGKALTDDGVLADAYWNCADMITPWLGDETGPDTLINSVCGSLSFLIDQWREKKALEQDCEKRDLIKQALAAHVERIKDLLDGTIESNLDTAPEYDRAVSQWLSDTPATSLTKRDLIKQAEALEIIAACGELISPPEIAEHARLLRQQAEDLNHD